MKLLFLTILLCVSSAFKQTPPTEDLMWIGTMSLYITQDGEYRMTYTGNYHPCFMKPFVDSLYARCDTFKLPKCEIEAIVDFATNPEPTKCKPPRIVKLTRI